MVDLVPADEQQLMRDTLRATLDELAPLTRLHAAAAGPADQALWPELGRLGWLGIWVPEADGGSGLGAAEATMTAFEAGRALVSPGLIGALLGAWLAASAGEPGLAEAITSGAQAVGVGIEMQDGATLLLADAPAGGCFLVWSGQGCALYPWAALSGVQPRTPLDGTVAMVFGRLDRTQAIIALTDPAAACRADLLAAAMLAGMADRATALAVDYAKLREQFGRAIGSFQAIKHRCADMAMRAAAAAAQVLAAALTLDDNLPDVILQAAAARVIAGDAAVANAAAFVQIQGGIGYTADGDAQLFVKRAQLLSRIGGDIRAHERRLLEAL